MDVFDLGSQAWSTITYPVDGKARSVSALLPLEVDSNKYLVTLFGEHDPSSLGHSGAEKMLGNVWTYDITGGIGQS